MKITPREKRRPRLASLAWGDFNEENELKWPSILKFGFKNNTASKIAAYNAKIDPERKYPPRQLQVTSAARAEAAGVTK